MIESQAPATLLQRIDVALTSALRNDWDDDPSLADGLIREPRHLLIQGVTDRDWPLPLGRTRLDTPHSGMALVINSFMPWRKAADQLMLGRHRGFDAIQFDVRCPTGLRGTPPHLDLLALRDDRAVAVTVRSVEYLTCKCSAISDAYDDLLAKTPGMEPWRAHLADWRVGQISYRHIDLPALVKYATALGRTFPDRSSTLLYLYWEPLDALAYDDFRHHRQELETLVATIGDARVDAIAQSFDRLWQDWSTCASPDWLARHVARLRSRYAVSLGTGN